MKQLLLSAALVTGLVGAAAAQTESPFFQGQGQQADILASKLIGMRVYASETPYDETTVSGKQSNWQDIGEIHDVVLSRDGKVEAVLVDIGGFLGMGERQVAVEMGALRMVADDATADDASDFFLVLNANRAVLEGAQPYGGNAAMPAATGTAPATAGDTGAAADAKNVTTDKAASGDATTMPSEAPGTVPEGFAAVPSDQLSVDMLQSADLYDGTNNRVGEVSDLVVDGTGKITEVVADVGGFLGIGEKRVALPMNDVKILKSNSDSSLRVYINHTEDQLKSLPTYEG